MINSVEKNMSLISFKLIFKDNFACVLFVSVSSVIIVREIIHQIIE